MLRLTLVRHGPSAHVHREGWIDAAGLVRWRAAYEAAPIREDSRPPAQLVAAAAGAGLVVASNAPRAIASAERLVEGGRDVVVEPLLRETDMRVPGWVRWPMPLAGWALAMGLTWARAAVGGEVSAEANVVRAREAVDWLGGQVEVHGSVLAVTHGDFRRLLAARLQQQGWRSIGARRLHTWSAWQFEVPTV